ncbi:cytochrome o ubiquinol oxidase, subunit III [Alicycliphilus sp. B1]|nr:cytochrome o ubiquinol oxidase, subunit III [Alicycliphilus sp. B1]
MSDTHTLPASAAALAERQYHLAHEPHPENGTSLGFWLYLMSDCLIFAVLFATYGVLGRNYAGGPTGAELFDLKLVAINTAFLLLSSITFGFAMLQKQQRDVRGTLAWLAVTGLLGLAFLAVELYEFAHLLHEGAGPAAQRLPVVLLHAGGHARPARDLRHDLARHADDPDRQTRPDPRERPPPELPVDVLALPGRGLDRRLHLCVPDGGALNERT